MELKNVYYREIDNLIFIVIILRLVVNEIHFVINYFVQKRCMAFTAVYKHFKITFIETFFLFKNDCDRIHIRLVMRV
jgi:hypothetical protein